MTASLIDLSERRSDSGDDPAVLREYLAPLVGEPFRFARVSYGDELTLHFGALRAARSPKLAGMPYGEYVLGLRASSWIVKSGTAPVVLWNGVAVGDDPERRGTSIRKEDVETDPLVRPESRVLSASPIDVTSYPSRRRSIGLALEFSDGSRLCVHSDEPDADRPDDDSLPEVADWELLSPYGLLRVGPGSCWDFEPAMQSSHSTRPNDSVPARPTPSSST